MDPHANLRDQEELMQEISEYAADPHHPACVLAQQELAALRAELAEWLRKGGFEPDWSSAPHARAFFGK